MQWLSRLVSILVIVLVVALFALWIRSKMPQTTVHGSFATCANFRDGSRLAVGSPVMIAGVRIGKISGLTINGNLAHVDMQLRDGITIAADSWITKKAYSAFGDSYLEIIPTGAEEGATLVRPLANGECLVRVLEGASTDTLLRSVNRIVPRVEDGLDRLHDVGLNGRKWASGTLEDSVIGMDHWLDERHIDAPLDRANQAMARLESATTSAANALHDAKPDIDRAFDRAEQGIAKTRAKISEVRGDMGSGFARARASLDDIDPTVADLQELLAAVDEGRGDDYKGKLGHLINDPSLANDLEDATDSLREGAGGYNRFKSWLGLRSEFDVFSGQQRFFATAEIRARTDKFYLVEFEKGPLGGYPDGRITNNAGDPNYIRHQEIHDEVRFTAQFGKTFGNWFQVRGGLKESTFGLGADVLIGEGRLKFSTDIYGSFTRTPRLKLAGALEVFRSAYLIAGVDDALNEPGYLNIVQGNTDIPTQFNEVRFGRDYFIGGSLHFDDKDLAVLLRVYGALLVAML